MLSSDQKGAVAEAAIVHAAARLGIGVSKPLTGGDRYDLIFDLRPRLLRVQCKWATRRDEVVLVRCHSSRRTRGGFARRTYSGDEIDAVAAYCAELERCYLLPLEVFGGRTYVQLRLAPCRNNQKAGVHWADSFDLGCLDFEGAFSGP